MSPKESLQGYCSAAPRGPAARGAWQAPPLPPQPVAASHRRRRSPGQPASGMQAVRRWTASDMPRHGKVSSSPNPNSFAVTVDNAACWRRHRHASAAAPSRARRHRHVPAPFFTPAPVARPHRLEQPYSNPSASLAGVPSRLFGWYWTPTRPARRVELIMRQVPYMYHLVSKALAAGARAGSGVQWIELDVAFGCSRKWMATPTSGS